MFHKIFHREFNLSFGQPKSDTCAQCNELHNAIHASSDKEKQGLIADQTEHNNKARMGYQTKIADKNAAIRSWRGKRRGVGGQTYRSKEGVDMLMFHFEQNLPTPMLKHNDVFYARQLWTYYYYFGIHDCVSDQVIEFHISCNL